MEEGLKQWSNGNTAKIQEPSLPEWEEIDLAAVDKYMNEEEDEHYNHIESCFLCKYNLELPAEKNAPANACTLSPKGQQYEPSLITEYINLLIPGTLHLNEVEGLERLCETTNTDLLISDPNLISKLQDMIRHNYK